MLFGPENLSVDIDTKTQRHIDIQTPNNYNTNNGFSLVVSIHYWYAIHSLLEFVCKHRILSFSVMHSVVVKEYTNYKCVGDIGNENNTRPTIIVGSNTIPEYTMYLAVASVTSKPIAVSTRCISFCRVPSVRRRLSTHPPQKTHVRDTTKGTIKTPVRSTVIG